MARGRSTKTLLDRSLRGRVRLSARQANSAPIILLVPRMGMAALTHDDLALLPCMQEGEARRYLVGDVVETGKPSSHQAQIGKAMDTGQEGFGISFSIKVREASRDENRNRTSRHRVSSCRDAIQTPPPQGSGPKGQMWRSAAALAPPYRGPPVQFG